MHTVWSASVFLYCSDAVLVLAFFVGVAFVFRDFSKRVAEKWFVRRSLLNRFLWCQTCLFTFVLVGFKFVVLSQSVTFDKSMLTGRGGSDQFSSLAELLGGAFVVVGFFVFVAWLVRRMANQIKER